MITYLIICKELAGVSNATHQPILLLTFDNLFYINGVPEYKVVLPLLVIEIRPLLSTCQL